MLAFLLIEAIASSSLYFENPPSRGDERHREDSSTLVEYWVQVVWTDKDNDQVGETQTYWGKNGETLANVQAKYKFLQPGVAVVDFGLKGSDDWF